MNRLEKKLFARVGQSWVPTLALTVALGNQALGQVVAVSNVANNRDAKFAPAVFFLSLTAGLDRGASLAQPFTTGVNPVGLFDVTLNIGDPQVDGGGFTVSLFSDSAGSPSTLVSLLTGSAAPNPAGLYSYLDPASTVLTANTTYWIVAEVPQITPLKAYEWVGTQDLSETGLASWGLGLNSAKLFNNGVGAGWIDSTFNALEVEVRILPVPEASTWFVGGAGVSLAGITWLRRRGAAVG